MIIISFRSYSSFEEKEVNLNVSINIIKKPNDKQDNLSLHFNTKNSEQYDQQQKVISDNQIFEDPTLVAAAIAELHRKNIE